MEDEVTGPRRSAPHLDLRPTDAGLGEIERLDCGLLGREPGGQALGGKRRGALRICDLGVGEYTAKKPVTEALDRAGDTTHLYEIDPDPQPAGNGAARN